MHRPPQGKEGLLLKDICIFLLGEADPITAKGLVWVKDTLEKPWGGDKSHRRFCTCCVGWEICWDLPCHQVTLLLPSCTTPLPSPSLQMSNATRAVPSPVAPGTLGPGTSAGLASAPPFSAVALLTAPHNNSQDDQQLFLTTTAAQTISGIFVWSALIVTFHQVWAAAEMGLNTGVNMRAKLSIAPKSIANHSAPGKYFFLLLPRGDIPAVRSLVLAAHKDGLCHTLPRWLPEPGEAVGTAQRQHGGAFGVFGVHSTSCLEAYPKWAWFSGLCRSMLLEAGLGQVAVFKHRDGAAQGRAHSSHSTEKEPDFHVFSCKGWAQGLEWSLLCVFTAMGLWWKAGRALTPERRVNTAPLWAWRHL